MLLSNESIKAGDICSFKLVNGDEIVAKVKEVNGDSYRLERPFAAMVTQQGLALVPVTITGTDTVVVDVDSKHIMMKFATAKEVADHYVQQTTGIQIATA